jgi:hypothetical protein
MNIATGEVLTGYQTRTGVDVLMFSKQIDATLPRGLAVHVVMENPRPAWKFQTGYRSGAAGPARELVRR